MSVVRQRWGVLIVVRWEQPYNRERSGEQWSVTLGKILAQWKEKVRRTGCLIFSPTHTHPPFEP